MLDYEMFNPYEGLIFDMDGTLIDTMPVHAQAWTMVGERFGYEFDCQIMYNFGGATVRTIAGEMMKAANMPLELRMCWLQNVSCLINLFRLNQSYCQPLRL